MCHRIGKSVGMWYVQWWVCYYPISIESLETTIKKVSFQNSNNALSKMNIWEMHGSWSSRKSKIAYNNLSFKRSIFFQSCRISNKLTPIPLVKPKDQSSFNSFYDSITNEAQIPTNNVDLIFMAGPQLCSISSILQQNSLYIDEYEIFCVERTFFYYYKQIPWATSQYLIEWYLDCNDMNIPLDIYLAAHFSHLHRYKSNAWWIWNWKIRQITFQSQT